MNGISPWQILREQFYSEAPPSIARKGIAWLQWAWVAISVAVSAAYFVVDPVADLGALVLAANAVFTALSITMAMFFWPRAINLKNDPDFQAKDERWHVYRLTTQLFWTVLVGILATGLAVVALVLPPCWTVAALFADSILVGFTIYQVILLGQCVFRLYAATFWMPRA